MGRPPKKTIDTYTVKVDPVIQYAAYSKDDYWYWNAALYRDGKEIAKSTFYPDGANIRDPEGHSYGQLRKWAEYQVALDKVRLGKVDSFSFEVDKITQEDFT